MDFKSETSHDIEIVIKKKITFRTVLNIYGILVIFALILSIFTVPISINENIQFLYNEDLIMETKKIKEFILFIFSIGVIYFLLVNIFYKYKN